MTTLRNVIAADDLATAVAANITTEIAAALAYGEFETPTAIGLAAWPDLTPNAAGIRISRLCKGKHARFRHIPPLAAALGIKCDDLTSTETDAARETRSRPAADDGEKS